MQLSTLDWSFVFGFFVLSIAIGVIASKKAGKGYAEFFLSGRTMPWWLLGFSMVATTFSDIVARPRPFYGDSGPYTSAYSLTS